MNNNLVFTRKTSGLVKGLSWKDILILVISAPAGSGILYYSVSTASTYPGGNIGISFLIGMALFIPVIYLAAINASMIPNSGSLYVLISRTVNPSLGFLASALFFIGYTLSIGVVAFVVTQVFGGILVNFGIVHELTSIEKFGTAIQTPLWSTIGGCFLVFLTWGIVLLGVKVFRNTMRILFYISLLSILVAILIFFFSNSMSIENAFNQSWGNGSYEKIIELAKNNGWASSQFSWTQTFNLLLVVLFSYGGLELISYASGETTKQKKKNIRAYVFAGFALGLLYTAIAFSVTHAYGNFIGAYDFVYKNHNSELSSIMTPVAPSIPFYISSIISNPILGILIPVGISIWLLTTMIPYFFAPSRIIFALAMDKVIPESMADVSNKTGAPTKASHLTLLFALLGVLFTLLNVGTVLGTILFCALFVYWLYGAGAIMLPFKNPTIYSLCPVKKSFLNIPVITWVGMIVFAIGWLVIFISVKQMAYDIIISLSIVMALLVLYYSARQIKLNKSGTNTDEIFNQLPPE
ncbi:APC family permease [Saccharicrinis sp. FJH2]|uniref:APC family permease n=1 Tax=Saccharicrinis sp. FJH65 TaxID=3344659 RepID=UPI0035F45CDA